MLGGRSCVKHLVCVASWSSKGVASIWWWRHQDVGRYRARGIHGGDSDSAHLCSLVMPHAVYSQPIYTVWIYIIGVYDLEVNKFIILSSISAISRLKQRKTHHLEIPKWRQMESLGCWGASYGGWVSLFYYILTLGSWDDIFEILCKEEGYNMCVYVIQREWRPLKLCSKLLLSSQQGCLLTATLLPLENSLHTHGRLPIQMPYYISHTDHP